MTEDISFKNLVLEVKRSYDIVDYIQASGVSLKRSGGGRWKGLCPFHNEKTPSFIVDENFQNFRCFGCGAHGDLVSYVESTENLDFMEALRSLAESKGIEVTLSDEDSTVDWRALKSIVKDTANFFYREFRKLPEDHPAVQQIVSRGLPVNGPIMYGYAPSGNALHSFLSSQNYSDDLIVQAGVCRRNEKTSRIFDFWQSRLMFFVTDIIGKPVGFSGRKLFETDTMGKYVNSPDTPLFNKSASLFNITNAKKKAAADRTVFVTEGQFDVAAMVSAGLENTVASLGTAFTEQQGLICRRLVSEGGRIVFCFDGDSAGVNAAAKVFKNIPAIHGQAYVVILPDGLDPCDFRNRNGDEALKDYVEKNQKTMIDFMLDSLADQNDLESPIGTASYVSQAAAVLRTIPSSTLREAFTRKVALIGFTSVSDVRDAVARARDNVDEQFHVAEPEAPQKAAEGRSYDDEDDLLDQDSLIEKIDNDLVYRATAGLFVLALPRNGWRRSFISVEELFPDDMRWLAADMSRIDDGTSHIVPEDFSYSQVVDHILTENLFPNITNMSPDDIKGQFIYLHEFLKKHQKNNRTDLVRSRVAHFLEQSAGDGSEEEGVEFLIKALDMEKKLLQECSDKG